MSAQLQQLQERIGNTETQLSSVVEKGKHPSASMQVEDLSSVHNDSTILVSSVDVMVEDPPVTVTMAGRPKGSKDKAPRTRKGQGKKSKQQQ